MNFDNKIEEIENNINLDIHINDEDSLVRSAVAEQGYGLDTLVDDEDAYVRVAVAGQIYGLDTLINDAGEGAAVEECREVLNSN